MRLLLALALLGAVGIQDEEGWPIAPPEIASDCETWRSYESGDPTAVKWATPEDFDGRVPFCRGYFNASRVEMNGSGWGTDGPDGDCQFLRRLEELTTIETSQPVVVKLDDRLLLQCPFVFLSDVGVMALTASERDGLRAYLDKGGFVWADDFWGTPAWRQWTAEMGRVVYGAQWMTIDPSAFSTVYAIDAVPQVPHIGLWACCGETSERGADSRDVHVMGLRDERGRINVLAIHNSDIADTWEESLAEPRSFFDTFSPRGFAIGTNLVIYALTH